MIREIIEEVKSVDEGIVGKLKSVFKKVPDVDKIIASLKKYRFNSQAKCLEDVAKKNGGKIPKETLAKIYGAILGFSGGGYQDRFNTILNHLCTDLQDDGTLDGVYFTDDLLDLI